MTLYRPLAFSSFAVLIASMSVVAACGDDTAVTPAVTPTRVIGDEIGASSSAANCDTLQTSVWSVPKAGGSATVLYTSMSGRIPMVRASGEYVYWVRNACNPKNESSQLFRRRADGSDAATVLVDANIRFNVVALDDAYVYWNDIELYRTPR